jgi:hypothetical protein
MKWVAQVRDDLFAPQTWRSYGKYIWKSEIVPTFADSIGKSETQGSATSLAGGGSRGSQDAAQGMGLPSLVGGGSSVGLLFDWSTRFE